MGEEQLCLRDLVAFPGHKETGNVDSRECGSNGGLGGPCSAIPGILQARTLEWVAISIKLGPQIIIFLMCADSVS